MLQHTVNILETPLYVATNLKHANFNFYVGFTSINSRKLEEHMSPAAALIKVCLSLKRDKLKIGLVWCGLMSNSAIFQLYSDGTVGQFSNLDQLLGTNAMDSKGLLRAKPTLARALGRQRRL